jgi:hypothetical protein
MSYYDALIAKWPTLAAGTVSDRLAAINALTVPGPSAPVPIVAVTEYLRSNNLWLAIKAATATSPGAAAAVDYNSDTRAQTIDFSLPIVGQMLADLVGRALLSQQQSDAMVALGATTLPWWKANGYRAPITGQDLVEAGLQTAPPVTPLA